MLEVVGCDKMGYGNTLTGMVQAACREILRLRQNAEVSEGGTRDLRIETAAQSRPSLH